MKTLKSIRLINFQSHRNTLINLAGPGKLTVITGPSDSGKSAVIRALRLVFYNVPQGDGFIFNAEDKCTASLAYDDGAVVERIRSRGGINRYRINDQTFEGFGTGVPLEVQKATGIRKLEIGDQSFLLNLSEQLDGPFLGKSVSGPARAKVLGKLAGTEEIDHAGKEVKTDLYRANRQKEILDKGIESLEADINDFNWVYSMERKVISTEAILIDTRAKVARVDRLKVLVQQWQEVCVKVIALTKVIADLQAVDKSLDLLRMAQDELTKGNTLAALRGSHFGGVLESERAKATLTRLDPVFKFVGPMIDEIVRKSTKSAGYTTMNESYNQLNPSVLSLKKITQRLSDIEKVVNLLQLAFNDHAQLAASEILYSRCEDSRLSVLSISRVVRTFGDLEQSRKHLVEAIYGNDHYLEIKELDDKRELFLFSRFTSNNAVTRYSGIDEVEGHLEKAFMENLRKLGVIEAHGGRASLVQKISQFLQLFGSLTQEVNETESDYLTLMSSLGKCPTCGNDIDIQKLKEAI